MSGQTLRVVWLPTSMFIVCLEHETKEAMARLEALESGKPRREASWVNGEER